MLYKKIYKHSLRAPQMHLPKATFCQKISEKLKGIDPSKITKKQFLQAELAQNPEFFKAFPHLKPIAKRTINENYNEKNDPYDQIHSDIKAKNYKFAKDYGDSLYDGYFDSLRQHRKDLQKLTEEELEKKAEAHHVDSAYHTEKAKKWMSEQEKKVVHDEVDQKMQELEDTGLTRMEILYNEPKGIPLSDDPVFQYLRVNRVAREMLVKPGEPFTADIILDKALRQDLEPDPTMAKKNKEYQSIREDYDPMRHYKQKFKDTYELVNEESYLYGLKHIDEVLEEMPGEEVDHKPKTDWQMKRRYDDLKWESDKPPTFINKPLTRDQARKKFMRKIDKNDFNWKDTSILVQFMTKAGKIKNRYQTRLSDGAQTRLSRVVKTARKMGMLPYVGLIRPTDKLSLRSFYEDLEEFNKKSIDPFTGKLYYSKGQTDLSKKYEKPRNMRDITEEYNVESKKVKQLKSLDLDQIPTIANDQQIEWLEAQGYILEQKKKTRGDVKGKGKDKSYEELQEEVGYEKDTASYMGGEISYEKIKAELDRDSGLDDLPDWFINEKANLDMRRGNK